MPEGKSVSDLQTTFDLLPLLSNSKTLGALTVDNITTYAFKPHVDGNIIPTQPSQQGVRVHQVHAQPGHL